MSGFAGTVRLRVDQAEIEVTEATVLRIAHQAAKLVLAQLDNPDTTFYRDIPTAAKYLGIATRDLRELVRAGVVPHSRSEELGRRDVPLGHHVCFRQSELRAWLNQKYEGAEWAAGAHAKGFARRRKTQRERLLAFSNGDGENDGWIYFAQSLLGGDLIKIGWTQDVGRRMADLKAEPLYVVRGGRADEKALHEHFAHLRREGEWFAPSHELTSFIERKREVV